MTGAGIALSLALAPSISAALNGQQALQQAKVSLKLLGTIGSFTPVTRDQRLALAYADAARESQTRGFKFTPASGSQNGERSLTVVVRAVGADSLLGKRAQPNLGLAPVAYSLGRAKGLDRFSDETAAAPKRELSPIADSVQLPQSSFALQAKPKRFSTNIQLEARQQTAAAAPTAAPQTLGSEKSYGVDLSSSYSLTRNLDVQAGVRYRGPDNRLVPLTDQKQDSQAVYVGTKFKF
ncbi:MAG: hypothetical protein J7494_02765 [Sphingobium sp.]|nr:hypothetical protein [Sphingobium sp.]